MGQQATNTFGFQGGNNGIVPPTTSKSYGAWHSEQDQPILTNNQVIEAFAEIIDYENNFAMVQNSGGKYSQITNKGEAGLFNLQFSAQFVRGSGGTSKDISIFIRKMGTNVIWSNTFITTKANDNEIVGAWNWFIALDTNEYIEIMWSCGTNAVKMAQFPENLTLGIPATPSMIITIQQVN